MVKIAAESRLFGEAHHRLAGAGERGAGTGEVRSPRPRGSVALGPRPHPTARPTAVGLMRHAPPESSNAGLYAHLREAAEVEARHSLPLPGNAARLAALRAGEPVDVTGGELPPWARVGVKLRWWTRAAVCPDGTVTLRGDDGGRRLAETGCDRRRTSTTRPRRPDIAPDRVRAAASAHSTLHSGRAAMPFRCGRREARLRL
jgi:hypothetical protein